MKSFLEIFKTNNIIQNYKNCRCGSDKVLYENFQEIFQAVVNKVFHELQIVRYQDDELEFYGEELFGLLSDILVRLPPPLEDGENPTKYLINEKLENARIKTNKLIAELTDK